MKRGTKLMLTAPHLNGGKPFEVSYFKKVRNSDTLIEVLFPMAVNGGGFYKIDRSQLSPVTR